VFAGTFDATTPYLPDPTMAPVQAELGDGALAARLHAAHWINGESFACSVFLPPTIYVLELPGVPFVDGYAAGARAHPKEAFSGVVGGRLSLAPAAAPPPPPPPPPSAAADVEQGVVVTAAKRAEVVPKPAAPVPVTRYGTPYREPANQAASLRAAAAAGRTAEVETLLVQGVPVDALDSDGNTALMKAAQADHPAAAALLRRHGASLDHQNNAGESARDMAMKIDDAALNQALGLAP